ncbi:MAG: HAD-IB family phosphatase [Gemmatimonadaceae bacterium]|nr:HAD-IB family phosphatase [Gemmatimonadaceae bacterium]
MSAFKSLVLDVDSTVTSIEGIDWLAARRDAGTAAWVADLTRRAMDGDLPLEAAYERRLLAIAPTREEIVALADAYVAALVPGVGDVIARARRAGVDVRLLSGGLQEAIVPLARVLGIPDAAVHAVPLAWTADGRCLGVADDAPLARAGGKPLVLGRLALDAPVLAVGDGSTDAELAPHVARFLAFTGVVRRPAVVAAATAEVTTFDDVLHHLGLA